MKFTDIIPWKNDAKELSKEDPFYAFRNQVAQLFQDFEKGYWPSLDLPQMKDLVPSHMKMDISETDKSFQLTAELPGMDAKDIELKLDGNALVIRGEKRNTKQDEKGSTWHRKEITYGSIYRSIQLPTDADPNKIHAHFEKGVLSVEIPKSRDALEKSKSIPINVS